MQRRLPIGANECSQQTCSFNDEGYKLSYRNIEELPGERGVNVYRATTDPCVYEYGPKLEAVFRRRKNPVSGSRRMLET